ncbi:MAG: KilA-N domain-containing protein [Brachymonas sp.]|nr:KilA-N domain-containing protein [Brachymonas sp.]
MEITHQYSLELIPHKVESSVVQQRAKDGYINATAMCKACGKQFNDYTRLASTQAFLDALAIETGIPVSELNQVLKGGNPELQGSWVHPQVAIHLAQWLSPKFAVMVSKWVFDWMNGACARPVIMPYHIERHMINAHKIPHGHFSILQEMTMALVAPMEARGYRLPESLVPDISQGKMLCKHLRDKVGIDTNALPTYGHKFPDGRVVKAKLYPIEHLPIFRKLMHEEWLVKKAHGYFKDRDPKALPVLDKMMAITYQEKPRLAANKSRFKRKA